MVGDLLSCAIIGGTNLNLDHPSRVFPNVFLGFEVLDDAMLEGEESQIPILRELVRPILE